MGNSNYLKDDFYQHLKGDEELFGKIITSNGKYFFVWDYVNQQHLWISGSVLEKLGFKSKSSENDLTAWKSKLKFADTPNDTLRGNPSKKEITLENSQKITIKTTAN